MRFWHGLLRMVALSATGVGSACAAAPVEPAVQVKPQVLVDARLPGGAAVELRWEGGRVTALGPSVAHEGAVVRSAEGGTVVPGLIDSHTHLAYLPQVDEMRAGGVLAVVDLAAPLDWVGKAQGITVKASGPMLTAPGGYPTQGWGREGYGQTCEGAAGCAAAVRALIAAGAGLIKVPLGAGPDLDDASVAAIVAEAHGAGLLVVTHALDDASAARAARLGVDGLAHTPVEALSEATVQAWRGRFVVSTLGAFSHGAVANLTALNAAGVTVLYGTDFGNTRVPGVDPRELGLLEEAGLSRAEILAALTESPAKTWDFEGRGALAVGVPAAFVVLEADPLATTQAYTQVRLVVGP